MPRKVLILTVGGSDEPLVSSIKHNKPDFIYFLCSDDTPGSSHLGSYYTVDGPGKPCGQVCTCQSCGAPTGETRPSIAAQLGLEPEQYTIVRISRFDNINNCYLEASRIIWKERAKDPYVEILADYTGGTKSMTAGLAAAAMDDGKVTLCVVSGRRLDLQKVESGTQSARLIDNTPVMVEKKLQLLQVLWQGYHYQSCLSLLKEIKAKPIYDDNLYDRLEKIRYLCEAYEAWDRFDHSKAYDIFKQEKDSVPKRYVQFLGRIIKSKTIWAELLKEESRAAAATGYRGRHHLLTFDPVFDLILNSRRRIAQGRYDDAVARLYRALEMFGQLNLLRWDEPLHTGNLNIAKLPTHLQGEYAALREPRTGTIDLGLIQNYTLLARLETPVGKIFERYKSTMLSHLQKRNNSLMAHGITPVDEPACREMLEFVEWFVDACCEGIKEKSRFDASLQFGEVVPGT